MILGLDTCESYFIFDGDASTKSSTDDGRKEVIGNMATRKKAKKKATKRKAKKKATKRKAKKKATRRKAAKK